MKNLRLRWRRVKAGHYRTWGQVGGQQASVKKDYWPEKWILSIVNEITLKPDWGVALDEDTFKTLKEAQLAGEDYLVDKAAGGNL